MTSGLGRTFPKDGDDRQVTVVDLTKANELGWNDNGARNVRAVTSAVTAAFGDVILGDTTGGAFSVTLPTPDGSADKAPITVKRQTGSNTLTAVGTINGSTNATVTTAVTYVTNGTVWFSI